MDEIYLKENVMEDDALEDVNGGSIRARGIKDKHGKHFATKCGTTAAEAGNYAEQATSGFSTCHLSQADTNV